MRERKCLSILPYLPSSQFCVSQNFFYMTYIFLFGVAKKNIICKHFHGVSAGGHHWLAHRQEFIGFTRIVSNCELIHLLRIDADVKLVNVCRNISRIFSSKKVYILEALQG